MADEGSIRSVQNHPPAGVPKYFDGSPYDEAQIAVGKPKSKRLALYDDLAKAHFATVPDSVTDEELAWLEGYHHERVIAEREERRMHFGAFMFVGILFFILLPGFVGGPLVVALGILELLLLVLIAAYVFVYFGYENRVRAMTLGLFRLMEVRANRAEAKAANGKAG
ncbi:MAG: hypothetical protein QM765_09460 [Myxococcales bacterium]